MIVVMMMATKNKGIYWDYKTILKVKTTKGTYTFNDDKPKGYGGKINFEIPFNTDGSLNYITITLFNLSKAHLEALKAKRRFTLESGPDDLFGVLGTGVIISRQVEQSDGSDYSVTIKCLSGKDYSKKSKLSQYVKETKKVHHSVTVKKGQTIKWTSTKRVKVNLSFKKNTRAKTIINRICRQSGITLAHMNLKTNKLYKKAFTVNSKPYNALESIVKACKSHLYYRRDGLVIDDFSKHNPYKENIYLSLKSGLISEPTVNDDEDSGTTYSLEMALDPRIDAGSVAYVKSNTVTGWVRVLNGTHASDGYTTTAEVKKIG